MSVKKTMDKTMTTLENAKKKTLKAYNFVNGLSVRNKANFDLSVKHDKSIVPLWKYGFGYNKEIRVMPVILCMIAAMIAVCTAMKIGNNSDK
ncbi:MAG: hypothetical protein IJW06_01630 [Clostridia bacterium]|nr:hypothetical protein [Clostridia bacterium]